MPLSPRDGITNAELGFRTVCALEYTVVDSTVTPNGIESGGAGLGLTVRWKIAGQSMQGVLGRQGHLHDE